MQDNKRGAMENDGALTRTHLLHRQKVIRHPNVHHEMWQDVKGTNQ